VSLNSDGFPWILHPRKDGRYKRRSGLVVIVCRRKRCEQFAMALTWSSEIYAATSGGMYLAAIPTVCWDI